MKHALALSPCDSGLTALLTAAQASAAPYEHDGFFFRGEVGWSYLTSSIASNEPGKTLKLSANGSSAGAGFFFGGPPAPELVVGGAATGSNTVHLSVKVDGVSRPDDDTRVLLLLVGPFLHYYPILTEGLHFGLTVGFATLTAETDARSLDGGDNGFGISGTFGYDFWVGREWSLGLAGRLTFARVKKSADGVDETATAWSPAVLFAFTYH